MEALGEATASRRSPSPPPHPPPVPDPYFTSDAEAKQLQRTSLHLVTEALSEVSLASPDGDGRQHFDRPIAALIAAYAAPLRLYHCQVQPLHTLGGHRASPPPSNSPLPPTPSSSTTASATPPSPPATALSSSAAREWRLSQRPPITGGEMRPGGRQRVGVPATCGWRAASYRAPRLSTCSRPSSSSTTASNPTALSGPSPPPAATSTTTRRWRPCARSCSRWRSAHIAATH